MKKIKKTIKKIELRTRRVRVEEPSTPYGESVREPSDVSRIAAALLDGEGQEVVLVFLLDIRNKVLGYVEVARGAVDACPADARATFRAAVVQGASAIILVHNHPSGDPAPSTEDAKLTDRIKKCGELLGVPLLDHVIVADGGRYSFAEEGRI
jgi:DNA repair protein RadC